MAQAVRPRHPPQTPLALLHHIGAQAEAERAQAEAERANQAEQELALLREELARLKSESPG